MNLEIFALFAALAAIGAVFWATLATGSPPGPTSPVLRRAILEVLPARLPAPQPPSLPGGTVYELGSGWGGLAFALARHYPDHPVIGIEASVLPWAVSRLRLLVRPQKNLSFRRADFHGADLSGASLVTCYLMPDAMPKLAAKLDAELKPGALVLANTFALPGWRALDERTAKDRHASKIYLYEAGTGIS